MRRKGFDRILRDLVADRDVNFTKMPGMSPALSVSMLRYCGCRHTRQLGGPTDGS
jgi:hypothetical protein